MLHKSSHFELRKSNLQHCDTELRKNMFVWNFKHKIKLKSSILCTEHFEYRIMDIELPFCCRQTSNTELATSHSEAKHRLSNQVFRTRNFYDFKHQIWNIIYEFGTSNVKLTLWTCNIEFVILSNIVILILLNWFFLTQNTFSVGFLKKISFLTYQLTF